MAIAISVTIAAAGVILGVDDPFFVVVAVIMIVAVIVVVYGRVIADDTRVRSFSLSFKKKRKLHRVRRGRKITSRKCNFFGFPLFGIRNGLRLPVEAARKIPAPMHRRVAVL